MPAFTHHLPTPPPPPTTTPPSCESLLAARLQPSYLSSRFLRARRFDPQKALKQFQDAELWRKKHRVDWLYATFDPVEFEDSRRFYPRWTGRRDKVRSTSFGEL